MSSHQDEGPLYATGMISEPWLDRPRAAPTSLTIKHVKRWQKILILLGVVVLAWLFLRYVIGLQWSGADWDEFFRPGALSLLDPYSVHGSYCPPWVFVLLLPLAILPANLGHVLLGALSLYVVWEYLERDTEKLLWLLPTAPMVFLLRFGQIDGLFSILGLMAPVEFSLVLLACKPQGVFLAGLRRLSVKSVAFLLAMLAVSFLIWGVWPVTWLTMSGLGNWRNLALLPYTLPLGAAALVYVWKRHGFNMGCPKNCPHDCTDCPIPRPVDWPLLLASVCFAPYYLFHSLVPLFAAILKETDDPRLWGAILIGLSWAQFFFAI